MKAINENIALKKYKEQIQINKQIKLEVPVKNLKILLEVKYKLKLGLKDEYTIILL